MRLPRPPAIPVATSLTVAGMVLLVVAAFSVPLPAWNVTIGLLTAAGACIVLEWCMRE